METRTLNPRIRTERRAEPPTYRQQVQRAINPATFEIIGTVPLTPEALIPTLILQARRAFEGWSGLSHLQRTVPLIALRNLIVTRADRIAEVIAKGMGKPLMEALTYDVGMVVDQLDDYISHGAEYLADQHVPMPAHLGRHKKALVRSAPRGVVCVIAPWNFPFELAMTPAITALAAGNAVMVKPTSSAPMVGELIEQLFQEAFRDFPGLVQVVHGPGRLGSVVATAEGVDFVVFTGSTAVGRRLQADLAPLLRPSLLELGGCDPMIVCEDANLERAANAAVFGRFCNNGQVCAAVKRVYVNAAVARPFLERVSPTCGPSSSAPTPTPPPTWAPWPTTAASATCAASSMTRWTRAPSWRSAASRPSSPAGTGPPPCSAPWTTPCGS
jgi:acyl-CoA reductase-like NAD-dependent aldehyde dehydrogenase